MLDADLWMDTEYFRISDRHCGGDACGSRKGLREIYPVLFRDWS